MPAARSTDVHTHLAPQLTHPVGGVTHDHDGRLLVDGQRVEAAGLYDPDRLRRRLAANGVHRAWVSAPPPLYRQGLDLARTRAWVRALDDGLRARLHGTEILDRLTYLPFDQPGIALELLEQTDDSVGWTAAAGGDSLALDDPALSPMWTVLAERRKPLLLHPGESPDQRLAPHYLANLLGNPVETGIAAAQLVFGGVLTRHPELRIVLAHCGGVLPALIGRWSRGVATRRPGIAADTADPAVTVRRLWTDCLGHSTAFLDLARMTFGEDHLLLGSDYPFPMGLDDPFEALAHLTVEARQRIGGNAEALLAKAVTP
ncbi:MULTISPECIES: amidohydrolase family protein [unclassified Crossiella]|uniref:amidohydrolase family protein n=1 Tax=unclassified Crossiella TaxID=2620835 RepID=UPI001FFFEA98|nr:MULTISPECIES: amidohydrolase family protein [unclassified Crossiella]MCK2244665.1 amidohydrolase [Crossiella sp. S99.2]MCK2258348.1 amidohydrolase [Crossiella sp. S99.1]